MVAAFPQGLISLKHKNGQMPVPEYNMNLTVTTIFNGSGYI